MVGTTQSEPCVERNRPKRIEVYIFMGIEQRRNSSKGVSSDHSISNQTARVVQRSNVSSVLDLNVAVTFVLCH